MTNLNKPVKRVTAGLVRDGPKTRLVVVIIRPPNVLGFRMKGCRKEYQLTAEVCYVMAVRAKVLVDKKANSKKRVV